MTELHPMTFGQYIGTPIEHLPPEYIYWLLSKLYGVRDNHPALFVPLLKRARSFVQQALADTQGARYPTHRFLVMNARDLCDERRGQLVHAAAIAANQAALDAGKSPDDARAAASEAARATSAGLGDLRDRRREQRRGSWRRRVREGADLV